MQSNEFSMPDDGIEISKKKINQKNDSNIERSTSCVFK